MYMHCIYQDGWISVYFYQLMKSANIAVYFFFQSIYQLDIIDKFKIHVYMFKFASSSVVNVSNKNI